MFAVGQVWENLYSHVDAVLPEKQERARRALNVAMRDIMPRAPWAGYQSFVQLQTAAYGIFYMPSDLARLQIVNAVDEDGNHVADARVVNQDGVRENRWLEQYRAHVIASNGNAYPWKKTASDVTLTADSAVIDSVAGDYNVDPADYGGWIQFSGELNARQVSTDASLTHTYMGVTKTVAAYTNPNRAFAQLYLPGSVDRQDAGAVDKFVSIEYTRFSEDLLHEDQAVLLPSSQALEYLAAAKVLRWEKRREDASYYDQLGEAKIVEMMDQNMQFTIEHSVPPKDWFGQNLSFTGDDPSEYSPLPST